MLQGIEQIVAAVRPTLGPQPRFVVIESPSGPNAMPERLDNAATIVRRIIALTDRDADMGAMLVRHLLWRQTERHGDGAATTAVLFHTIVAEGLRYIASGGNAMVLRRHLQRGMHPILDRLAKMAQPLRGKAQVTRLAQSICYDPEMAGLLGEIFDIVGEYGYLEIRAGQSRGLEREYVEGLYWDGGLLARSMLPEGTPRIEIENAAILVTNLDLENPQDLIPALEVAMRSDCKGLVITARGISDGILALIQANTQPERFQIIAVKIPTVEVLLQAETVLDLGVATGGRAFVRDAGDSLARLAPADLGHARRAWANMHYFGISGGQGDPRVLRQRVADLRRVFYETRDEEGRERVRKRIGKLMGGTAILHVGGLHELEVNARKEVAERTATVLRSALREGVVPGGGAALLACRDLFRQERAAGPDERAAYRILETALAAPLRQIVENAGYDVSHVMAELENAEPGWGFDVERGTAIDLLQAGIMDAVAVQRAAVANAISTAALALTVDVLVHHKRPETVFNT
jgi:chaperonin GroEL